MKQTILSPFKKIHFASLFFGSLLFITLNSSAQSGVVVSGGDATGANGKVSYSVGQTVYQAVSGPGTSVIEGNQQPYEISTVSGTAFTEIALSATAYPNPTIDHVTLSISGKDFQQMSYALSDINGKMLAQHAMEKNQVDVSMNTLPAGTYFIKVIENNSSIKIFKIVKNN